MKKIFVDSVWELIDLAQLKVSNKIEEVHPTSTTYDLLKAQEFELERLGRAFGELVEELAEEEEEDVPGDEEIESPC